MKWLSWSFNDFGRGKWLPFTLGLCLMMGTASTIRADSPTLECFATSDLDRVFEDGYGSLESGRAPSTSLVCAMKPSRPNAWSWRMRIWKVWRFRWVLSNRRRVRA